MVVGKKLILVLCIFYFHTVIPQDRPLNILFVVDYFPCSPQIYILNLITGLIDKGHNVSIFSFHHSKDKALYLHPNIEKYNLLERVTYEKFPKKLPKADIVFCQFGGLGKKIFEMPSLFEWLKRRKVVVCFRGADTTSYLQKNPTGYNRLFKKGNLFLPVCDYFKKQLISFGCPAAKTVVYHSAIDCSKFSFKTRTKPEDGILRFVSVCRLVKKKGLDYAIKAIAEIVKQHKNVHYTIVGEGTERRNLEALIEQLNLQEFITLYGWATQDEVVSIVDSSHIFLLPSITLPDNNEEGIANALKEAMAMGLVSIGTFHAGTPELIDNGVSGFLVPEKNVAELVNTIEYVIDHPDMWESIGVAAREKVENEFEVKQLIEEIEQLFYKLMRIRYL